jgi:hypothetical protein
VCLSLCILEIKRRKKEDKKREAKGMGRNRKKRKI